MTDPLRPAPCGNLTSLSRFWGSNNGRQRRTGRLTAVLLLPVNLGPSPAPPAYLVLIMYAYQQYTFLSPSSPDTSAARVIQRSPQ